MPDNQHALSGSWDKTVKLFNVDDGAVLRTFKHHTELVRSALLPDGRRFARLVRRHGLAPILAKVLLELRRRSSGTTTAWHGTLSKQHGESKRRSREAIDHHPARL